MLTVRKECAEDIPFVYEMNSLAFPTDTEARLVDALRATARPIVSLVAMDDNAVVGHIMFTPVELLGNSSLRIMGLAPMAVTPERQHCGIGSQLVREGLRQCKRIGAGAVVVLGHPTYYPRFGFEPATRRKIDCEYDVPPEAFMIIELTVDYLSGAEGTIRYHETFAEKT